MSKAEIMMGGIALASITTNPAISSIVIILSSVSALIAIYFFRGFAPGDPDWHEMPAGISASQFSTCFIT